MEHQHVGVPSLLMVVSDNRAHSSAISKISGTFIIAVNSYRSVEIVDYQCSIFAHHTSISVVVQLGPVLVLPSTDMGPNACHAKCSNGSGCPPSPGPEVGG